MGVTTYLFGARLGAMRRWRITVSSGKILSVGGLAIFGQSLARSGQDL
jgi:hypothetical protein